MHLYFFHSCVTCVLKCTHCGFDFLDSCRVALLVAVFLACNSDVQWSS